MVHLNKASWYSKSLFICWGAILFLKLLTDSIIFPGLVWCILFTIGILTFPKIRLNLTAPHWIWSTFMLIIIMISIVNYLAKPNFYVQSFPKLIFELVFVYFVPLAVGFVSHNCKNKSNFFLLFRNFMIFCSLLGIFEYVTKNQFYTRIFNAESIIFNFQRYGDIQLKTYRMVLVFFHPIYYAVLQVCGLVCLIYMPLKKKLLNYIAGSLMILNILLTQSRTGWLLLALLAFLYFTKYVNIKEYIVFSRRTLFFYIGILGIASVAIIMFLQSDLYITLKDMIISRAEAVLVNAEYGARLTNFSLLKMLAHEKGLHFFIFGGGLRFSISYLQSHPTTMGWVRAIDNEYLTILMDGGIICLLLLVAFVISCVIHFYQKRVNRLDDIPYLICIIIFTAGFFLSRLVGILFIIF